MSPQWIYNNKSKLPHVNMNSKPLFKKSEVDHWLESFRVNADNELYRHCLPKSEGIKEMKYRQSGFNQSEEESGNFPLKEVRRNFKAYNFNKLPSTVLKIVLIKNIS